MNGTWNGLPIIIFGTGAMSTEAEDIIRRINIRSHMPIFNFLGFVSNEVNASNAICTDEEIAGLVKEHKLLGAIIPFADGAIKERIYNRYKDLSNLVWPNLIDPDILILNRNSISLGIGNIIEAGATINRNVKIGSFNLININAIIGHDCHIGDFCTVNPGAILSGGITVENNVLVGAAAVVKQNLRLGKNSVLGLGAFTVKNLGSGKVMVCNEAHELERK